uniref:Insulin like growth factor binding protein 7 n=1 Tax=Pelusios castaneus TaxID=367368 RepID=A0A8C8RZ09_9SAUR
MHAEPAAGPGIARLARDGDSPIVPRGAGQAARVGWGWVGKGAPAGLAPVREDEACGPGARCAAGLECAPRPGRAGPTAVCVCKSRYPVCGSDGLTYPSACRLRAAALSAQRRGQRGPSQRRKGACEQGPSIVTPPKEIWNVTGAQIYLSCEVMGIPTPVLTWNKIIRGQYGVQKLELLPGDRDNLAIQTRGGPEKHEVTGWVLISPLSKEDDGEYECRALNSKGEATASARITVVDALHEIPLTKVSGLQLF